jgi:anionic cell wall polymer biosynthesis LytR-Cps2A-Psr (LCP) family protein
MMIASFNPEKKAVTMLSIPRDLFVNKDNLYKTKINGLLPIRLNEISDYSAENIKNDFGEAEDFLREKVEDITGLTIPYYVGVSFQGFQDFIDELG